MIDPVERSRELGLPDKPDYAGLLTYAGMPYTQDPGELAGVDVAIVGAPTDDLVSDRPGTRFGPRAIRAASCPPGPHLEAKVDAFEELRIVDFGDAAVVPAVHAVSRPGGSSSWEWTSSRSFRPPSARPTSRRSWRTESCARR